jgi:exopolysaccharide biosynthesis polyprenyl glycosylphosphotransferase
VSALRVVDAPAERLTAVRTAPPRRAPTTAAVPAFDAAALAAAVLVTGMVGVRGVLAAAVAFVALAALGTHVARINPRLGDDAPRLLAAVVIPLVAAGLVGRDAGSDALTMTLVPVAAGLVVIGRAASYGVIRAARSRGLVFEPTVIVGAGEVGATVAQTLADHPEYGLVPVGFLDTVADADRLPVPLLGSVADLETVVRQYHVRRVIVAFGVTRESEMVEVFRAVDRLPVEVSLVPRFFELGVSWSGGGKDEVWGIPLVRVKRALFRRFAWGIKRAFDLVVATAALILSSPLFAALALGVRLSSPGPVFFKQTRIGQRGTPFSVLKFRTLRVNDESDTEWSADDDRVTGLGRVLRWTSLDELPQLLNVIVGNMSMIGPRPERPFFVDRFSEEVSRYDDRHRVPVGITGWAQVHGLRGDTSIPQRVRFDNHYIENWSLWTDVVILVRTVFLILRGRH